MTTTVLLALIKKLEGKVDSLETISFEPVTELPETGEPNIIYLVPKSNPETGNYSDEYIWDSDNQTYEKIGDTQVSGLPEVSAADNGKILGVENGEWGKVKKEIALFKAGRSDVNKLQYTLANNKKISDIRDAVLDSKVPIIVLYNVENCNPGNLGDKQSTGILQYVGMDGTYIILSGMTSRPVNPPTIYGYYTRISSSSSGSNFILTEVPINSTEIFLYRYSNTYTSIVLQEGKKLSDIRNAAKQKRLPILIPDNYNSTNFAAYYMPVFIGYSANGYIRFECIGNNSTVSNAEVLNFNSVTFKIAVGYTDNTNTLYITNETSAFVPEPNLAFDVGKVLAVASSGPKYELINLPTELPVVTSSDEGKVLEVNSSGEWAAATPSGGLPAVTSADEGKFLTVDSNGNWVAAELPDGSSTPYPLSGNGDTVSNLNTDISVEDVI